MDAENLKKMAMDEKFERPIAAKNFFIFGLLISACLLFLLGRAFQLQIIQGSHYAELAYKNQIRLQYKPAPRGVIYDRYFQQLVYNIPIFDLTVVPADLPKDRDELGIIQESLVKLIGEEERSQITEKFAGLKMSSWQPALIKSAIDYSKFSGLEMFVEETPGFSLTENITRRYDYGYYFSHLVGYTAKSDNPALGRVGKTGLESQYDNLLAGEAGRREIEVNSLGKMERLIAEDESVPGKGIVLSLDSGLQIKIYDALSAMLEKTGAKAGAAVVLDPRDGRVVSLVSLPGFDNNLFVQGSGGSFFSDLFNRSDRPLINRAINGLYSPGSTVKPIVASGALEEGVVSETKQINCPGALYIGSFPFNDWKTHGVVSIKEAIAQSCDVFFYYLGGGYGDFKGLGVDNLAKYYKLFGLGDVTGIDLPGEAGGLVPTVQWKKDKKNEPWYIGNTYHISIGQGDLTATPLQMANATAAIANGGTLYRPQILFKVVDTHRKVENILPPVVIRNNFIDAENLKIVREGMRLAVTGGSAAQLTTLPVEAAGKTGTAQYGSLGKTHAWFVGFAPFDNPQLAVAIIVEGGGDGHSAAVPIAKEIFSWYYENGKFEDK